ncbi:MAG: hypothetical protein ACYSWQ_29235, partial [Planctomycetota bacterium]
DYTKIRRDQAPWNFRLVFSLANNLRYQEALQDIRQVFGPAEDAFFKIQMSVEEAAGEVAFNEGARGVEHFLNAYAEHGLKQVGYGYNELADYLMFRYLVEHWEVAPPKLPVIGAPAVPVAPAGGWSGAMPEESQRDLDKEFK